MFRALRKLFGGSDNGVAFPPSKVFAMELLTKSLATSTTNDRNLDGRHTGFFIENRDLSEYIALMRRNSRSWAEQQDKVLFWNKESFDESGMTEHKGYNTGSVVQGIYVGRAKRLLNTVAKVKTQAQLLALWKDKDRVDSIIVYMMAVEWEIKNTLDRLKLEINR
tara:strand:+ start:108 stop:602 length:495 start_codon:yes stop_codon:yes gene_type:complete